MEQPNQGENYHHSPFLSHEQLVCLNAFRKKAGVHGPGEAPDIEQRTNESIRTMPDSEGPHISWQAGVYLATGTNHEEREKALARNKYHLRPVENHQNQQEEAPGQNPTPAEEHTDQHGDTHLYVTLGPVQLWEITVHNKETTINEDNAKAIEAHAIHMAEQTEAVADTFFRFPVESVRTSTESGTTLTVTRSQSDSAHAGRRETCTVEEVAHNRSRQQLKIGRAIELCGAHSKPGPIDSVTLIDRNGYRVTMERHLPPANGTDEWTLSQAQTPKDIPIIEAKSYHRYELEGVLAYHNQCATVESFANSIYIAEHRIHRTLEDITANTQLILSHTGRKKGYDGDGKTIANDQNPPSSITVQVPGARRNRTPTSLQVVEQYVAETPQAGMTVHAELNGDTLRLTGPETTLGIPLIRSDDGKQHPEVRMITLEGHGPLDVDTLLKMNSLLTKVEKSTRPKSLANWLRAFLYGNSYQDLLE